MKKVASFAIEEDVLEEFKRVTNKAHSSKSAIVEDLIRDFLKGKKD